MIINISKDILNILQNFKQNLTSDLSILFFHQFYIKVYDILFISFISIYQLYINLFINISYFLIVIKV